MGLAGAAMRRTSLFHNFWFKRLVREPPPSAMIVAVFRVFRGKNPPKTIKIYIF